MPEAGVPGAAVVDGFAPGDRVVGAHVAARVRRFVEGGQHVCAGARVALVVVELVGARPGLRQVRAARVCPVLDPGGDLLDGRVRVEVGADQLAVEGPAVFGVGGGVHADITSTATHVRFEGRLLPGVEDVAGGVEEDHRLVRGEVGGVERGGVLGGGDGEVCWRPRGRGSSGCRPGSRRAGSRRSWRTPGRRTGASAAAVGGAVNVQAARATRAAAPAISLRMKPARMRGRDDGLPAASATDRANKSRRSICHGPAVGSPGPSFITLPYPLPRP